MKPCAEYRDSLLRQHPSFGVFTVYRASILVRCLVVSVSGRIEHRDQCCLGMNAGFRHGTLQLGADRVDGETEISCNFHGPATLREALNHSRFRLRELPDARRLDSPSARVRAPELLHVGMRARSLARWHPPFGVFDRVPSAFGRRIYVRSFPTLNRCRESLPSDWRAQATALGCAGRSCEK